MTDSERARDLQVPATHLLFLLRVIPGSIDGSSRLDDLSLWHSRPIGNSSMRIASRRYPTGRSDGDHPIPPLRGMSASVGRTGRLRGFRGGTPAPRMCWGTRTPPLQEAAPHARPGCGVPGPRVSGLGGRLVLLRGCREPTPYTAPAAPAPCGDGQKFHSGRACPRGGGQ